jgi:glycosyltransferase involved in cell wall biosynthesis
MSTSFFYGIASFIIAKFLLEGNMLLKYALAIVLFISPGFLECSILLLNKPVEFVIVIPSYNNEKWCMKNLESVVNQTYPHWSIIYINDCSEDQTRKLVTQFIKERGLTDRFTILNRKKRKGAMANYYYGIMRCPPRKVVATLDGDDWLAHPRVLEKLAAIYADKSIWATHGNYTSEPLRAPSYCRAYPAAVLEKNSFRKYRWMGCQLRTFYAKLFHLIKKEDFMWKGEFLPMTSDLAFMFPILELTSQGHLHFIEEPIYVVNTANPISDVRKNRKLQLDLNRHIRSLPPYKPLKSLF